MNTEELIATLAAEVTPVRRNLIRSRLLIGLGLGALATIALIAAWLGFNPDLGGAMGRSFFWMKLAYCLALSLPALASVVVLARPDGDFSRWRWTFAVPVEILGAKVVFDLARTPASGWLALWLGESWMKCPWTVLVLSVPIFLGLLWAFRAFAPTRLAAAGAAAGLLSGALAASLYCLHCPEVSALFVLTWYSLGMGLAALVGRIAGPVLLRW